jgi:hypothetical protein
LERQAAHFDRHPLHEIPNGIIDVDSESPDRLPVLTSFAPFLEAADDAAYMVPPS